ncbi:hypothetical protein ES703_120402 [subsurface metagenome]
MAELLFIALNIADAYLTKAGLLMGAVEANPLAVYFGSSLIAKGMIAVLIIIGLYWFGREKSLWWMNFIVLAAVLWNFMQCVSLHVICGIPWPI